MNAWHGSQELKDRIVARMHAHRAADAFVQGEYQMRDVALPLGYRGCAIGCLLDQKPDDFGDVEREYNRWHLAVEAEFGIPADLADEIDATFEYFTESDDAHARASDFAVAVVEAIPVGADLSGVTDAFDGFDPGEDLTDLEYENRIAAKLIELIAAAPVAVKS